MHKIVYKNISFPKKLELVCFEQNLQKTHRRCSVKKEARNHLCFIKNFIKKIIQHRYFSVKLAKLLRTAILMNTCRRLILNLFFVAIHNLLFEIWREIISSKQFFYLQNHCLNNRCCRKFVSKRGGTKVFLKIIFKVCIFAACNMQQNQNDLILLYVAGSVVKNVIKQLFRHERRWDLFKRFVKSIFLLRLQEIIVPCLWNFKNLMFWYFRRKLCLEACLEPVKTSVYSREFLGK